MKTLVSGGAGFVGSHLVDALVERGDEVTVIDDLSTGRDHNLAAALERGARLVVGDVTQRETVERLFADDQFEAVLHLAAQIDVRRSVADPGFDARSNVEGTVNLLDASRRAGTGRFVFASTGGAIYGEGDGRDLPLAEDADCRPDSPYGQSKLAAEGYVDLYRRLHDLPTVSLRLGNVYGPRQDPLGEAGVVAIFCGRLAAGDSPVVFGDGRQTRDYVYIEDVVAAFLATVELDVAGVYNVGTGRETEVLELARSLARLSGNEAVEPRMEPARSGEIRRIAINSRRAARDLGWRAGTTLEEGLRRTLAAF
jgi:UDP-glucose 4-epimerase